MDKACVCTCMSWETWDMYFDLLSYMPLLLFFPKITFALVCLLTRLWY